MDILVTTPKSEIETSCLEGEQVEVDGGYWFRTFRFKPKVDVGDKIFFVEAGLIKGYGIIFEICANTEGGMECETTGRVWKGDWIIKYDDWHWLKDPVIFKGFQGIRYIPNLPVLEAQLNIKLKSPSGKVVDNEFIVETVKDM